VASERVRIEPLWGRTAVAAQRLDASALLLLSYTPRGKQPGDAVHPQIGHFLVVVEVE